MTLDPSNRADAQATVCPQATVVLTNYIMPDIASFCTYAWYHTMLKELHHYIMPENAEMHHFMCLISHEPEGTHYCTCSIYHMPEEIHHRICPILTYARRTALLHALDILCARRNASLHVLDISCARGNTSSHMPNIDLCSKNCIIACSRYFMCSKKCTITYARYCMCPILYCAWRSASLHCARYCMCPKKCIIACARYCMCPKKCIIALCPRLHCARSLHKLKNASCSKFTCARIKSSHKSINRFQKQIRSLYSLFIFQRCHPPKASSFMACGLHVMASGLILCLPCP